MFPVTAWNVSGHRLGTKEIESAALVVEEVAEAAVVPVAHEIKGKEPDLYIALKPGLKASDELAKKISDTVCVEIGKIAKPRKVWIARSCAGCWVRFQTTRTSVM
jgi:acetyl-CoA synthetase